jgi:galactitol-specific phosphotransferase system IIB component
MSFKIVKVGRASDNDVVLKDASVSRYHCEFFFDENGNVFLTDKDSSNGTFVNGKKISGSVQLNPNDIVKPALDLPLRWRTFFETSNNQQVEDLSETFEHIEESKIPLEKTEKSGSLVKTILITLGIILFIGGILFALNEYWPNDKPEPIDKDKPNAEGAAPTKTSQKIDFDFSCLEDENDLGSTRIINEFESIDSELTNVFGGEISISEEEQIGEDLLTDCRQRYRFIESGVKLQNIQGILKLLVKQIKKPKGYNYKIYLLESNELNAFTAGAKIFVTTTMYDFCKSNDELACIIGHEINHNELGHIKQHLQKKRILTEVGATLQQILTVSFGQKKEVHCDMTGIDLAIAAGYNGCVNIGLWKRMKKASQEGNYNAFENLLRSHPYSDKRAKCSKNHISKNYGFNCVD